MGAAMNDDHNDAIAGSVYILVNAAMPGLLKIGHTRRELKSRIDELSQASGVAVPFVLAYDVQVSNSARVESLVHERLRSDGFRLTENREFFTAPLRNAIEILEDVTRSFATSLADSSVSAPAEQDLYDQLLNVFWDDLEVNAFTLMYQRACAKLAEFGCTAAKGDVLYIDRYVQDDENSGWSIDDNSEERALKLHEKAMDMRGPLATYLFSYEGWDDQKQIAHLNRAVEEFKHYHLLSSLYQAHLFAGDSDAALMQIIRAYRVSVRYARNLFLNQYLDLMEKFFAGSKTWFTKSSPGLDKFLEFLCATDAIPVYLAHEIGGEALTERADEMVEKALSAINLRAHLLELYESGKWKYLEKNHSLDIERMGAQDSEASASDDDDWEHVYASEQDVLDEVQSATEDITFTLLSLKKRTWRFRPVRGLFVSQYENAVHDLLQFCAMAPQYIQIKLTPQIENEIVRMEQLVPRIDAEITTRVGQFYELYQSEMEGALQAEKENADEDEAEE
jgi:hypothetical protein